MTIGAIWTRRSAILSRISLRGLACTLRLRLFFAAYVGWLAALPMARRLKYGLGDPTRGAQLARDRSLLPSKYCLRQAGLADHRLQGASTHLIIHPVPGYVHKTDLAINHATIPSMACRAFAVKFESVLLKYLDEEAERTF